MLRKSKPWLALGVIGLLAPSPPARADCDGCVVAAINAHKEEMIRQFTLLKNLLLEQFKTVRQSIAQVEKDSLRARADLAFRPPARACETATAGGAAGPARDRAEAYHRALDHIRRAERTGAAAGEAMVKAQVERYCSAEDAGSRGCAQASGRPDAQFQTETLYSGSGLGAGADPTQPNTFLPEVLSFDDDRIADARRLIDNAADPYPTDDLPKALRETPQGKTFWIRRKLYEGRLSASRHSLNHALAWRMPAAGLKAWLLQIWQESRATEHKNELIAALPENISYLETLKAAVDSRYAMPSWYAGVAGNNEAANLRELAYMQALGLNFQYLQLRQGERIEGLLARANIGDAHQNERKALQEERAAAINLVKPATTTTGSGAPNPNPNPNPDPDPDPTPNPNPNPNPNPEGGAAP